MKLFWGANIEEFYKELKHPWEVLNSRIQNEFFLEDNKLEVSNYSERYKHLLSFFNIVWLVDFQWLEACCTVKPQFMKGKPFCWPSFLYPVHFQYMYLPTLLLLTHLELILSTIILSDFQIPSVWKVFMAHNSARQDKPVLWSRPQDSVSCSGGLHSRGTCTRWCTNSK